MEGSSPFLSRFGCSSTCFSHVPFNYQHESSCWVRWSNESEGGGSPLPPQ